MKHLFYFFLIFINFTYYSILSQFVGDFLKNSQRLESENGKYFVEMQNDGNFVLYSKQGLNGRDSNYSIWNSNTMGKGNSPYDIRMQTDGNLVIYDTNGRPIWASNTMNMGSAPYRLIMQDDGNLVIYDKTNKPIWSTGTYGRQ